MEETMHLRQTPEVDKKSARCFLVAGLLATGLLLSLAACQQRASKENQPASSATQTQQGTAPDAATIERGKYLVTVAGCGQCHTPQKIGPNGPEPDETRLFAGHPQEEKVTLPAAAPAGWAILASRTNTAFYGPWGVVFAANLTPDEETGLGIWDEEMFIRAMRTGKQWGQGRDIIRIMPWHNYAQMTDDDLKAIFAYLKSLPPIKNEVPQMIEAKAK
jgi:mono/diheme cytochrome c family protein